MKQYILNRETRKIELQFDKSEYKALHETDKKELKRFFLFAPSRSAWVSRSTDNHYSAIRTAEKLGFVNGGEIGERLSFAEQVERKTERAEARAERMEHRADKAVQTAEQLQAGWNEASKDWSYVTQPNINSSRGRAFSNQRQRLIDRYQKGFEEYRKSEYFRDKAVTARETASGDKFKDRTYLNNRIEECNKEMRSLERLMIQAEERNDEQRITRILERMEYELDKLAYLYNCLDEIGGIQYNKDNVKAGYIVKIRGSWDIVVKANTKTVEVKFENVPYTLKYPYAEIQDMKIPEGWTETNEKAVNPFTIDDIMVRCSYDGKRVIKAFQITKTTDKSVTMQEIAIENDVPVINKFISEKQERRAVKQSRGNNVVNYGDWYLYKYQEDMSFTSVYG